MQRNDIRFHAIGRLDALPDFVREELHAAERSTSANSWTTRVLGSTLLLDALGLAFSPTLALVVLCLAAAASVIPITSGGAIANVGATAAVLLTLGVHKEQAINFGLASGLLLVTSALAATVCGTLASLATGAMARHRLG